MAIYHMQAKVVSRGKGRSAVAASAYMSCSSMTNEYDGVHHDYTRKKGMMWERVFLPENAPTEWQERSALWNAVEDAEKILPSIQKYLMICMTVSLIAVTISLVII